MPRFPSFANKPHGDPVLAAKMRALNVPAPVERIVGSDWTLTAVMRGKGEMSADPRKRIAIMECGHRIVTRNRHRAPCPKCHDMILNGEDYDAFRNHRDGVSVQTE